MISTIILEHSVKSFLTEKSYCRLRATPDRRDYKLISLMSFKKKNPNTQNSIQFFLISNYNFHCKTTEAQCHGAFPADKESEAEGSAVAYQRTHIRATDRTQPPQPYPGQENKMRLISFRARAGPSTMECLSCTG